MDSLWLRSSILCHQYTPYEAGRGGNSVMRLTMLVLISEISHSPIGVSLPPLACQRTSTDVMVCGVTERIVGASSGTERGKERGRDHGTVAMEMLINKRMGSINQADLL